MGALAEPGEILVSKTVVDLESPAGGASSWWLGRTVAGARPWNRSARR
jgi:hypothetical protein